MSITSFFLKHLMSLILMIITMFFFVSLLVNPTIDTFFALSPNQIVENPGKLYTIITYTFINIDFVMLSYNLVFLIAACFIIENKANTFFIYISTISFIILPGLFYLILSFITGDQSPIVGTSNLVYAYFGFLIVLALFNRFSSWNIFEKIFIFIVTFSIISNILLSFFNSQFPVILTIFSVVIGAIAGVINNVFFKINKVGNLSSQRRTTAVSPALGQ